MPASSLRLSLAPNPANRKRSRPPLSKRWVVNKTVSAGGIEISKPSSPVYPPREIRIGVSGSDDSLGERLRVACLHCPKYKASRSTSSTPAVTRARCIISTLSGPCRATRPQSLSTSHSTAPWLVSRDSICSSRYAISLTLQAAFVTR